MQFSRMSVPTNLAPALHLCVLTNICNCLSKFAPVGVGYEVIAIIVPACAVEFLFQSFGQYLPTIRHNWPVDPATSSIFSSGVR